VETPNLAQVDIVSCPICICTVRSESRCALRLCYVELVASTLPLNCAAVLLYSVVKQRLKCKTGNVCIKERVFISAQRLSERTVFPYPPTLRHSRVFPSLVRHFRFKHTDATVPDCTNRHWIPPTLVRIPLRTCCIRKSVTTSAQS
jgi:hypothetical protein